MKTHFVFFCGLFCSVMTLDLEDPHTSGVSFVEKTETAQIISIDENNDGGRVNFVKITGVNGTIRITVSEGNDTLQIQLEPGDDATENYLSINLVDYEAVIKTHLIQNNILVTVALDSDLTSAQYMSLNITNLDDESPVLLGEICTMKEETIIDINNSDCVYQVSDPDGFLSKMDFSGITGSWNESDLFEFKYKEIPKDDVYESDVYLVLKEGKTLDYETVTLHNFHEDAKDSAGHPTAPLASVPVIVEVEDIPDQLPEWIAFRVDVQITNETRPTEIQVAAIDGDYGINSPIIYGVVDYSGYVHINGTSGLITVDPIPKAAGVGQIQLLVVAVDRNDFASNIASVLTLLIMY